MGKVDARKKGAWTVLFEFIRYVIVGGIAFLADFGTLVLMQEFFLKSVKYGVYIATVFGFIVGLFVNYILSLLFVFTQEKDRGKGRDFGSFVLFGVIGLLGLFFTELGMWIGIEIFTWNYMIVKVLVTGAVLVWNYLGRKLLIFNSKEGN
jgi:putative flippase GtrA